MNDRQVLLLAAALLASSSTANAQSQGARPIEARAAVHHALSYNPHLRAAHLDLEQARQGVLAEEGRYPYVFQADAGFTRNVIPRLAPDDSVTSSVSRTYSVGTGLRKTFPFGTTGEVRIGGERFENDLVAGGYSGSAIGLGYGVVARASVLQPLMRGAGTSVGELELRAARISQEAAEKGRDRVTSELVRDVLSAYWELWYSGEAVTIEQQASELAKRQEAEAKTQVELGALQRAGVLTFSTRVAQLEESVVAADIGRTQRALELSRLMGASGESAADLVAVTDPSIPGPTPTRAQVESALQSGSLELAELEAQVRAARARAEVAGEGSRPRLDLEGYVETQGVSERIPRAAERAGQLSWTTAHVGVVFELPLDDSRRLAERSGATLAVRIAEQNVQAARDRIAAEASTLIANEQASRSRLALAERTLNVAEQAAQAEQSRFELGQVIAIQVQQADDEVRRARLRVARARVDLAQSQAALLHLSGGLMGRYAGK